MPGEQKHGSSWATSLMVAEKTGSPGRESFILPHKRHRASASQRLATSEMASAESDE